MRLADMIGHSQLRASAGTGGWSARPDDPSGSSVYRSSCSSACSAL